MDLSKAYRANFNYCYILIWERSAHNLVGAQVLIISQQQSHHQFDDLARGEVLTGSLIGRLSELTVQLIKDIAHPLIADVLGVQVHLREVQHDLVGRVIGFEVCNGVFKLILIKDVAHVLREAVDVIAQVQNQGVRVVSYGAQVVT